MILQSLLRTYFLDLALETAWEKVWKNFILFPTLKKYPKTAQGLLDCSRCGELYTKYGVKITYDDLEEALGFGFPMVWQAIGSQIDFPERFIDP